MSFVILAAMLSPGFHAVESPRPLPVATPAPTPAMSMAAVSAMAWAALLDRQRWDDSWDQAGASFKSQVPKSKWAATIQPLRRSLGPVSSRALQGTTRASLLPGAPPGEYEIVAFKTKFATNPNAIETVVMARESQSWKVNGYFIR